MAARLSLTYSWTSRRADFSQLVIRLSTSAPGPRASEAQLAALQRLDLVTQGRGALEVEVGGRLAHLSLQLFNARFELRGAQIRLAVFHDGRRAVIEVVDRHRDV